MFRLLLVQLFRLGRQLRADVRKALAVDELRVEEIRGVWVLPQLIVNLLQLELILRDETVVVVDDFEAAPLDEVETALFS